MPKRSLRSRMLKQREGLAPEALSTASRAAQQLLLALPEYAAAGCVALYMAIRGEIDTTLLLERCLQDGKRVLMPAVCGETMVFRPVDSLTALQPGCFGIPEPDPSGAAHDAAAFDLLVVPGVAFDHAGHRIGFGRGYYDRFLDHDGRSGALVGLCHDFQLIDENIPVEGHDIRMDKVVTDRRVVSCSPQIA